MVFIIFMNIWHNPVFTQLGHFLAQSQQWKQKNNVWNLLIVTTKTLERRRWHCSGVFIVNFKQTSIVLVFPWLSLDKKMPVGKLKDVTLTEYNLLLFSKKSQLMHCLNWHRITGKQWHLIFIFQIEHNNSFMTEVPSYRNQSIR